MLLVRYTRNRFVLFCQLCVQIVIGVQIVQTVLAPITQNLWVSFVSFVDD